MRVNLIVAMDEKGGIGKNGLIPWNVPEDLHMFRRMTKGGTVVMGRRTWESLQGRPLPGRQNIVIGSHDVRPPKGKSPPATEWMTTTSLALALPASTRHQVWIIGGARLYQEALPMVTRAVVTHIPGDYKCDVVMNPIPETMFTSRVEQKHVGTTGPFTTVVLKRWNKQEHEYLKLVRSILNYGDPILDRTGTGVRSLFGPQLRFSLNRGKFPLMTTKRVALGAIVKELLWFLRGSTNANELKAQGCNIWNANAAEFAARKGLPEVGPLGPVYGHQWRHFGQTPNRLGVDQILQVIQELKTNRHSRRLVVTAWNPQDLEDVALPPCHVMFQFHVSSRNELSCKMYQRSADMGLGVPFNIASYALLTYIIGHFTGYEPHELFISFGNAHVYNDHVEALRTQLTRIPYAFPKMKVTIPPRATIDTLRPDYFHLQGYHCFPALPMPMSV